MMSTALLRPRRRLGITSPHWVGVESNPGPKGRAQRKEAKIGTKRAWSYFTESQLADIKAGFKKDYTCANMARENGHRRKQVERIIKKLKAEKI